MSVPPGTEMFQFPGLASCPYVFRPGSPCGGVSPFGHPRINDRSHLPAAFRSVPRPSSPLGAKASTKCPLLLDTRISPQPSLARRPLIPHATPNLFGPGRRRLDFRILIKTRRSVRAHTSQLPSSHACKPIDVPSSQCHTTASVKMLKTTDKPPLETQQKDPRHPNPAQALLAKPPGGGGRD